MFVEAVIREAAAMNNELAHREKPLTADEFEQEARLKAL